VTADGRVEEDILVKTKGKGGYQTNDSGKGKVQIENKKKR
jgi:hypothetical protein